MRIEMKGTVWVGPMMYRFPSALPMVFVGVVFCGRRGVDEWFMVVARGGLAEACRAVLSYGQTVYIEGRLGGRHCNEDGQLEWRDVFAGDVQLLDEGLFCITCRGRPVAEGGDLCPTCGGSGGSEKSRVSRATKGGNVAYVNSLKPGGLSMSERGKRGGRPRVTG